MLWQSLSLPQPPFGTHTSVVALQVAERHTSGCTGVQGPLPFGWPHLPSSAHSLLAHSAAPTQSAPFGSAQLSVTALQAPLRHTAAFGVLQLPSWMPSLGIGSPGSSFGAQVYWVPSQYSPLPQSLSAAQPELGMHTPPLEHTPD